jgi:hypothetical protein
MDVRVRAALAALLAELADGASKSEAWMLNPGDDGLLRSLEKLSAADASRRPRGGGASIAAHVDHLRYGLSLMNRWGDGDEKAFTDANYSSSWRRIKVSDAEWLALRHELRDAVHRWHRALLQPREMSQSELNGVIGSVAHLAYHLGAIRQIDRSARGPAARD